MRVLSCGETVVPLRSVSKRLLLLVLLPTELPLDIIPLVLRRQSPRNERYAVASTSSLDICVRFGSASSTRPAVELGRDTRKYRAE